MARPDHLFVFAYDVAGDRARVRLADLLEAQATRVQKSVFEARLTTDEARRLTAQATTLIGVGDSLRVYCITEAGRRISSVHGPTPMSEPADYWLL